MSESLIESESTEPAAAEPRDFVVAEDTQPERPEWLPEKYNTGEDLAKAYKELESKLGGKEEDIKNKLLEEIQAEAFGDRPETAGDYQLPDIIDEESAVDSELLQWWSEHLLWWVEEYHHYHANQKSYRVSIQYLDLHCKICYCAESN